MTKTCPGCGRHLEPREFNFKKRSSGLRQVYCKDCSRKYVRDHYRRNTGYYIEKAKLRNKDEQRRTRGRVLAYLSTHPCTDCGETDPVVLDFDHIMPANKSAEIGVMIKSRHSWHRIESEIAKCEVRCANCHRRRTAAQFDWYKFSARSSIG